MGIDGFMHYAWQVLEVFFVNLLLSGDNAVVIALACRSLPSHLVRRAMLIGIEAAIVMRVLLAIVASLLMRIPLLQLAGGIALLVIAIRLTVEHGDDGGGGGEAAAATDLWSAVGTIFVADLVMSIDNVVALAAVAQGSPVILSIGLLISVPFLLYGSLFVSALLRRYPLLKRGGGAMLGWLAGDIAISDPTVAPWVSQQSPALGFIVPLLAVVYVLYQSRIIEQRLPLLRPLPRRASRPRPPAAPATAPVAPPAGVRRFRPLPWVIAGLAALMVWGLMHLLSLDDHRATPAVHFSEPVRTR